MSRKIRLALAATFICLIAALVFASMKSIDVQNQNQNANNNASERGACEQACTRSYQDCRRTPNASQTQCKKDEEACRAACKAPATPSPTEMPSASATATP